MVPEAGGDMVAEVTCGCQVEEQNVFVKLFIF